MQFMQVTAIDRQLVKYLTDAHAIEEQSLGLLRKARGTCEKSELREICEQQLERAEAHRRLIEDCLQAHGAKSSALKDAAMRLGAINWTLFFQVQADTPGRFAAFVFARTHLKIAGYELLRRVASSAGDRATVAMAEQVLGEERAGAALLRGMFDKAVEASLQALPAPGEMQDAQSSCAGVDRFLRSARRRVPPQPRPGPDIPTGPTPPAPDPVPPRPAPSPSPIPPDPEPASI
jgi:ferritin-like metal-binding protein YciE